LLSKVFDKTYRLLFSALLLAGTWYSYVVPSDKESLLFLESDQPLGMRRGVAELRNGAVVSHASQRKREVAPRREPSKELPWNEGAAAIYN